MKNRVLVILLLMLAMSLQATGMYAQHDRSYVKNQISKWGGCKNVALTKTNGDVALYGTCGYAAGNVPVALLNKLKELNKSNTLIDDVQLTESGRWCVLYGKNDAAWANAPTTLANKINEFHNNNYVVRSITFNDKMEWVIVSDEYFAASSTDLNNWLKQGNSKYGRLCSVCITDDAAIAVYQNGFCVRGNVPSGLLEALRKTSYSVYRLKVSGNSWFFADTNGNYTYYM